MTDERGMTLVELLVAASLMVVVLGAVLTTFDSFHMLTARTVDRNETQERARLGVDVLARDARNAVSATSVGTLAPIERAQPYDLVFQSVGRTAGQRERVRYCLDDSDANNGKLLRQVLTYTGTPPALASTDTACPLAGWTTTQLVADHVTNRYNGSARNLFAYRYSTTGSTALNDLLAVTATLYTDVTPGMRKPEETVLRSAVLVRNANKPPEALFTVAIQGRRLVLNGSASIDPEKQTLQYDWTLDGPTPMTLTGVRAQSRTLAPGTYTVTLKVTDPANASAQRVQTIGVT
jgi:type II secretory pathway component PulJ